MSIASIDSETYFRLLTSRIAKLIDKGYLLEDARRLAKEQMRVAFIIGSIIEEQENEKDLQEAQEANDFLQQ